MTPPTRAPRLYRHTIVEKKQPGDPGYSHVPTPGPESVTAEEMAAWVAQFPFVYSAASPKVQRALAYIDRFSPRTQLKGTREGGEACPTSTS